MQLRQRLQVLDLRLLDRGRADRAGVVNEMRDLVTAGDVGGDFGERGIVEQVDRDGMQLRVRLLRRLPVEHDDLVTGVQHLPNDGGADS